MILPVTTASLGPLAPHLMDLAGELTAAGQALILIGGFGLLLVALLALGPRWTPAAAAGGVLACAGWETGFWMNDYIHAFGWIIGGGTNEIQRNVIGERMLGLPRDAAPVSGS